MKWPPVVDFFRSQTVAGFIELSAAGFIELLQASMQIADGKDWPLLFSRMNSGLGHATTGMAIHLTQLHLITTTASAGKRRKREKVLDQDASNMVYLGA